MRKMSDITIENFLEDKERNIISVVGSKVLNKKGSVGYVLLTREHIMALMDGGNVFYSKNMSDEGGLELLKVNLIIVDGKQYLRVDEREIPHDRLTNIL